MTHISVVMPVFAETTSIGQVVSDLVNVLEAKIKEIIIVLSPKSPQSTFNYCKKLVVRYPRLIILSIQRLNPGYGRAVIQGMMIAKGSCILIIDSDGELDPRDSIKMYKKYSEGFNIVLASRWTKDGGAIGYGTYKYFLTRLYSIVFKKIYRTQVHDLSFGYKLIKNDKLFKKLNFKGNYHDLATETTLRPLKAGFSVTEVPTIWKKRVEGRSKNNLLNNFRYVIMACRVLFFQARLK